MEFYNSVRKLNQNGEVYKSVAFSLPLIRKGEKESGSLEEVRGSSLSGVKKDNKNKERAVRRAKSNIRDYIKTNVDLNYFVTYTLDPKLLDRYNSVSIYSRVKTWLSNGVSRKGFKYVLVPEKHKDGAWHFHGFVSVPLEWDYGYSLCKCISPIETGSSVPRDRCINYIVSYVKKGMEKFNGRYYLHSKNLDKPVKIYGNVNFLEIEDCYCMELEGLGAQVKIWSK